MDTDLRIKHEVIPFLPPSDKPKIPFLEVKYTIGYSSFKNYLPIFKSRSPGVFLHFLYKFNHSKSKLEYTTYPKLESGLEQLLKGTAKDKKWATIQPGTKFCPIIQGMDRSLQNHLHPKICSHGKSKVLSSKGEEKQ